MKRIPLTKGKEALVDDQDYDYLMQWKWQVVDNGNGNLYAQFVTSRTDPNGRRSIRMHTLIGRRMGLAATRIDHIDGDGLNNQRYNLRDATRSQNGANRGPTQVNTSGYKGVSWCSMTNQWEAKLRYKQEIVFRQRFDDIVEAAKAYNEAALKHFGEFAVLNPI